MIEAAQVAARGDPGLKAWHNELRRNKGYSTATAALARKLLVAAYHILRKHEEYRPSEGKIYKIKNATLGKPVCPLVGPA